MLIALTGLHCAGKSFFAENIMEKYGFTRYYKVDLINKICKEETGRDDGIKWYREEFNKDPYEITKLILSYIDLNKNIALDSVHSDLEWNIIKTIEPSAELIGIITPEYIRKKRREKDDDIKDVKRKMHWHNGGGCLLSELSWSFNGGASIEINQKCFEEFIKYIKDKNLSNLNENKESKSKKVEKIESLIKEDNNLENKINEINDYIKNKTEMNMGDRCE